MAEIKTDSLNLKNFFKELVCSNCDHVLTPPIIQCCNGHIICSECKKSDMKVCNKCGKDIDTQIPIFENLLNLIQFPCKFKECKIKLSGEKLLEHENQCDYRPCHCFFSSCYWTGTVKFVQEHTKSEHASQMIEIKNGLFPLSLDIVNQTFNPIIFNLFLCEHFFHLNILINSKEIILSLTYIGTYDEAENFNYTLSLKSKEFESFNLTRQEAVEWVENTKKSRKIILSKHLYSKILDGNILNMNIEIKSNDDSSPFLAGQIFEKLKCPICLEFMRSLIHICEQGHSFCHDCRFKVSNCPMCRGEIKNSRNYSLEVIAQIVKD